MKRMLILLCLLCTMAQARDIRLIVPYSPGGSTDRLAQILAFKLSSPEYNFVVDYRLGAAGSVAANYVSDVKKETVVMITSNGFIANPLINHIDNYSPENDFVFVSYLGAEPLIITVPAVSKINNFKQFLQASKTQQMQYGSSGIGSSSHLTSAIVANQNPNLRHIPYKGGAQAMTDFLAGRIAWIAESDSVLGPYIAAGNARPLAVVYHKRLAQYPTVPTVREYSINDRDFYRWHIMVANRSADPEVIKYLKDRFQTADIKDTIKSLGIDTTPISNPDSFFKNETAKLQKIIKDYDITH